MECGLNGLGGQIAANHATGGNVKEPGRAQTPHLVMEGWLVQASRKKSLAAISFSVPVSSFHHSYFSGSRKEFMFQ